MTPRSTLAAILVAGLAGCASCDHVPAGAVTDCNAQIVPGGAAADILFVIDDSPSMSQEQDELANNLADFIDQLVSSAISLDLHVGVTNTSVEDYAEYLLTATGYGRIVAGFPGTAGTPYPQGTLIAIEQDASGDGIPGRFQWGTAYDPAHQVGVWGGPRLLISSATSPAALARDFKANVRQGVWGSTREQPLSAMQRALDKSSCPAGPNCGFLRAGARLAVVILTDEDDCSGPRESGPGAILDDTACQDRARWGRLDPLDGFVSYLDTTIGGQPVVGLIAGYDPALAPSACTGASTKAWSQPNRLDEFVNRLEAGPERRRTVKASICQPFSRALMDIAAAIMPQTMPLRESPADFRMMVVSVHKPSGEVRPCQVEQAGAANAASAGAIYTPALPGGLPSLTFQGACKLSAGDRVDLRIVCAG